MKPGPATSTFSMLGSAGICAMSASAILRGAQWASLAERIAMVDVHSP